MTSKLWFNCTYCVRPIQEDCNNCRFFVMDTIIKGENLAICNANLCPCMQKATGQPSVKSNGPIDQ